MTKTKPCASTKKCTSLPQLVRNASAPRNFIERQWITIEGHYPQGSSSNIIRLIHACQGTATGPSAAACWPSWSGASALGPGKLEKEWMEKNCNGSFAPSNSMVTKYKNNIWQTHAACVPIDTTTKCIGRAQALKNEFTFHNFVEHYQQHRTTKITTKEQS